MDNGGKQNTYRIFKEPAARKWKRPVNKDKVDRKDPISSFKMFVKLAQNEVQCGYDINRNVKISVQVSRSWVQSIYRI